MRRILLYFSLKYKGDYKKIYNAIVEKQKPDKEVLNTIESKIKCNYLTILDENYPESLKKIYNPPWVIYYYGDINLINNKNIIGIIGTRNNSVYGKDMCQKIVKECKEYNCVIISGLALGIDVIAHKQALDENIKTIAVLGSGIDYCYPKDNQMIYQKIKNNGLVISEYPNILIPRKNNFLIRNRLIAALANQLVVIEAAYKSGTMNTVTYALEYGKDVGCVPTLATHNSGCNYLIKQGAKLIECAKDIFND